MWDIVNFLGHNVHGTVDLEMGGLNLIRQGNLDIIEHNIAAKYL